MYKKIGKRMIDIFLSALALLVLAIPMFIIARLRQVQFQRSGAVLAKTDRQKQVNLYDAEIPLYVYGNSR